MPDEGTPLLGDRHASTTEESELEAAMSTSPSNQSGRTLIIRGGANADGRSRSGVVKKTPLPWAQFSVTLLLQVADHLTAQVISPVSSPISFFFLSFALVPFYISQRDLIDR